jgi:glutathione synthase/RimK-type ligase-like ATP-grasp enzyme
MSTGEPAVALATSRDLKELWAGDRLFLDELRRRGVRADPVVWDDDAVDWGEWDLVVIRSCWDYHLKVDRFRAWLDALEARRVPLLNPAPLVRWNLHKGYLLDAARAGARIPPTRVVARGEPGSLGEHVRAAGWMTCVIKPAISASGHSTRRVPATASDEDERVYRSMVAAGDVLLQEYVPQVAARGEWSFVFFDGRYSHAALKRAAPGEFRVHIEWGGTVDRVEPPPRLVQQAQRLVGALDLGAAYARVDGTEVSGGLTLMELELVEPELFFDHHPQAAGRLADVVLRVVPSPP